MGKTLLVATGAAMLAALVTNLLVPSVARIATALRALDYPGNRRFQTGVIPRLGGVAIFLGLGVSSVFGALAQWRSIPLGITRGEILAFAFSCALILMIGVIDDLQGVSVANKFIIQFLAAWILVHAGWAFEVLRLPFLGEIHLGVWGVPVSVLWIVGVTNAINLLDGLDGLASGVVAIIATSMLGYAAMQGNTGTILLMAATVGACLGFLRHNWEPARIFMGDSGSLGLGFLLGAVSVHSSLKAPAAVAILVPVLALGLPIMDTLLVMGVRFLDRPKSALTERFMRMFHADRKHLHYLLSEYGARRSAVVAMIYGVVLVFCSLALLVAALGHNGLGLALLLLEFVVLFCMRRFGFSLKAGRLALRARESVKIEVLRMPVEEPAAPIRIFRRR
jgi:UDP-GlcNAc:undecaprenyl-phosphate GlcNAc-1-phosphate transferase